MVTNDESDKDLSDCKDFSIGICTNASWHLAPMHECFLQKRHKFVNTKMEHMRCNSFASWYKNKSQRWWSTCLSLTGAMDGMDGAERCTDCSFEFGFIFLLLITVILSRYFIKRDLPIWFDGWLVVFLYTIEPFKKREKKKRFTYLIWRLISSIPLYDRAFQKAREEKEGGGHTGLGCPLSLYFLPIFGTADRFRYDKSTIWSTIISAWFRRRLLMFLS